MMVVSIEEYQNVRVVYGSVYVCVRLQCHLLAQTLLKCDCNCLQEKSLCFLFIVLSICTKGVLQN